MLGGESNENGEETTIGLISKNATLYVQPTFFVNFFAVILHDYIVKLPETSWLHVFWSKCGTCSCSPFFRCRSFSPWWPPAFLIFSPLLRNLMLLLLQNMSPLFFLSRSSSFSRWASLECRLTFSFSLSFSLSIFQIFGHDNQSKLNNLDNTDTETFSAFRFCLYWLFSCLCFPKRRRPYAFPPK